MGDGLNLNGIDYAIYMERIDKVKYLMSFDEIKKEYEIKKHLRWRCVYWNSKRYDESIASYLMKELDLNEEKLKDLQSYKYEKAADDQYDYSTKTISDEATAKLLKLIKDKKLDVVPLTAEMLKDADPAEKKRLIGERLSPKIEEEVEPKLAAKITEYLLKEIDNSELLVLLTDQDALKNKINEVSAVLDDNQKQQSQQNTVVESAQN